jgi:hypothetical protein
LSTDPYRNGKEVFCSTLSIWITQCEMAGWQVNSKWFGYRIVIIEILSWRLLEGTEENHKKTLSREPMSQSRSSQICQKHCHYTNSLCWTMSLNTLLGPLQFTLWDVRVSHPDPYKTATMLEEEKQGHREWKIRFQNVLWTN